MAQVLIRDIGPELLARLKARAKRHGRSLQGDLKDILERASRQSGSDARALAARIRKRLAGRTHSDSTELISEDRAR